VALHFQYQICVVHSFFVFYSFFILFEIGKTLVSIFPRPRTADFATTWARARQQQQRSGKSKTITESKNHIVRVCACGCARCTYIQI